MPGSVFKLITASAGLDSGIMSTSQTFYCGGSLTVNEGSELWEHTYRCANGEVHRMQDMAGALNNSCNLWFIQAAETLKPQIFYDYIQAFGFTQPTGIDLPNETRWTSVYNAEQMAEVDTNLYTAAFGQNESITPCRWQPLWRPSPTAATLSRPMWWTPSQTTTATLSPRPRQTSAARSFQRTSAASCLL